MSDFFSINLESQNLAAIQLTGVVGDASSKLYMSIVTSGASITLLPGESLSTLIIPSGAGWTDSAASGLLSNATVTANPSIGLYTYILKNESTTSKPFSNTLYTFEFQNYTFENSVFDLHWIQKLPGKPNIYNNHKTVYCYPHNLQGSEVSLSVVPINNATVRYYISFPTLVNDYDSLYTGTHQPYQLGCFFHPKSTRWSNSDILSGVIDGNPVEFSINETSGFITPSNTGLVLELPMYDPREGLGDMLAGYVIYAGYRGAGGAEPRLLNIFSLHSDLVNSQFPKLELSLTTSLRENNIQKVGEYLIPEGTINRNRMSIGIKDIYISKNVYNKKGVYVSPVYTTDAGIYSFSLRVKENIPNYPNIDLYSTVRYFVEFNGLDWEPISPVSRNTETVNNTIIPKLLVLDKGTSLNTSVKFIEYPLSVTNFRIKIVFDISAIEGLVVPPEVKDYKCVIFDKTQILEL